MQRKNRENNLFFSVKFESCIQFTSLKGVPNYCLKIKKKKNIENCELRNDNAKIFSDL